MAPRAEPSVVGGDAHARALTEELGAQLGHMKGAGAKIDSDTLTVSLSPASWNVIELALTP